ncbi:hypothetical protein SUGI_0060480 [Cryptomeria japonica]|nr:hypothetical protein SUGI_0060480 [Cryptomeria japonica]
MLRVLLLHHAHRGARAMLEINGARVSPSEGFAFLSLHRDRLDKDFAEATYVSTDNVRITGTLHFEVYNGDLLLLCGTLHNGAKNGF